MKKKYHCHENAINAEKFDGWIMSLEGIKRVLYKVISNYETNSVYVLNNTTIEFWKSGERKDCSEIELIIEGKESDVSKICNSIEKKFPGLKIKD